LIDESTSFGRLASQIPDSGSFIWCSRAHWASKGDLNAARRALAEAMKLKPEVDSLLQWRAHTPWATKPRYMVLAEPTLYVGLRRAGFPDE
jgi:hypothetical protein